MSRITIILIAIFLKTSALALPQRFCETLKPPKDLGDTWSGPHLQKELLRLTRQKEMISRPWNAYPLTYVVLTKERDKERCKSAGDLAGSGVAELIGDKLADIMSRQFILQVSTCSKNPYIGNRKSGFCNAMQELEANQENTIDATLRFSTIYLSSHMANSLIAVILDDSFWEQVLDRKSTRLERISRVLLYRPLYDKNNGFLAARVSLVIETLLAARYLEARGLATVTQLIERLPITKQLFKLIRDRTYDNAIGLAIKYKAEDHPMMTKGPLGWEVNYKDFQPDKKDHPQLRKLDQSNQLILARNLVALLSKQLGGKTRDQLQKQPTQSRAPYK